MIMTFADVLETVGEGRLLALAGLGVGALFGFAAQRSRFCLRSAVIEFASGSLGSKVAVWLLTFGSAVFVTQMLIASGLLDVSNARLLAARGSLSGALVGGVMFGIGMILSRGCASRLLVLSANGNLRALLSGLVFAVAAQSSYAGVLSPLREAIAGAWTIDGGANRDLLSAFEQGSPARLAFALVFLAMAIALARRSRLTVSRGLWSIAVGLAVALGWLVTYQVAITSFEPVAIRSVTFSGPSAEMLMMVLNPPGKPFTFELGLIPGVFLGSFAAAAWRRELKIEGFHDGYSMRRYIFGAVLMGFGAMLAGGCAVGAGVTGGAVFALTAWVALAGMWLGAGVTDLIVDRPQGRPQILQVKTT
jgi:uncharacterized membrane protein YedE/YeeE